MYIFFLFFMLNELDEYKDFESFKNVQIRKLFEEFKKDYISNNESFGLIKKLSKKEFEDIQKIIYLKMCR